MTKAYIGSIPAGGSIVDDERFLRCSRLEFRLVYDFHSK